MDLKMVFRKIKKCGRRKWNKTIFWFYFIK